MKWTVVVWVIWFNLNNHRGARPPGNNHFNVTKDSLPASTPSSSSSFEKLKIVTRMIPNITISEIARATFLLILCGKEKNAVVGKTFYYLHAVYIPCKQLL
jgi:hypothetical protein